MSEIGGPIDDGGIGVRDDPFVLFESWLAEARASEPNNPDAMSVASVDSAGRPNVRLVLLKEAKNGSFVFYTNYESAKGVELIGQPQAALCFLWKTTGKQVRVRGSVAKTSAAESDAYFATRPKDSQIGCWASAQSRAIESRWAFEKEIAKYAAKFALATVPRPPHWGGFRVTPWEIEFWREKPFRLHDRLVYRREGQGPWTTSRLYP